MPYTNPSTDSEPIGLIDKENFRFYTKAFFRLFDGYKDADWGFYFDNLSYLLKQKSILVNSSPIFFDESKINTNLLSDLLNITGLELSSKNTNEIISKLINLVRQNILNGSQLVLDNNSHFDFTNPIISDRKLNMWSVAEEIR